MPGKLGHSIYTGEMKLRESVIEHFGKPDDYSGSLVDYNKLHEKTIQLKIDNLLKRLKSKGVLNEDKTVRILDIGCWKGQALSEVKDYIEKKGFNVEAYGVTLVKHDKQSAMKNGLKIVTADAERLPFPDNYFHLVLSVHSIEHMYDKLKVIEEAHRVLAPEGLATLHVRTRSFATDEGKPISLRVLAERIPSGKLVNLKKGYSNLIEFTKRRGEKLNFHLKMVKFARKSPSGGSVSFYGPDRKEFK